MIHFDLSWSSSKAEVIGQSTRLQDARILIVCRIPRAEVVDETSSDGFPVNQCYRQAYGLVTFLETDKHGNNEN